MPDFGKRSGSGGVAAIEASNDPLIRFVRAIQPVTRATRTEYEAKVQAPTDQASEKLARARFAVYGTSLYPDATGTLRLTYGRLKGWSQNGRTVPYATTFAGLWDRATGTLPFDLPHGSQRLRVAFRRKISSMWLRRRIR